jgi:hypothetical protein
MANTSASPRLMRFWGRARGHTRVTGSANTWGLADLLGSVAFKYVFHKSALDAPSCRLTRFWIPICFAAVTSSGYLRPSLTMAHVCPWSLQSNSQTALALGSGACSVSTLSAGIETDFLNFTERCLADLISSFLKVSPHRPLNSDSEARDG